jgi:hypothetical protein
MWFWLDIRRKTIWLKKKTLYLTVAYSNPFLVISNNSFFPPHINIMFVNRYVRASVHIYLQTYVLSARTL